METHPNHNSSLAEEIEFWENKKINRGCDLWQTSCKQKCWFVGVNDMASLHRVVGTFGEFSAPTLSHRHIVPPTMSCAAGLVWTGGLVWLKQETPFHPHHSMPRLCKLQCVKMLIAFLAKTTAIHGHVEDIGQFRRAAPFHWILIIFPVNSSWALFLGQKKNRNKLLD